MLVDTFERCQRTKNSSFGVNTPSLKTGIGVSSGTGRWVITISGRFRGRAPNTLSPLPIGSLTIAPAAASAARPANAAPPNATPARSSLRRPARTSAPGPAFFLRVVFPPSLG